MNYQVGKTGRVVVARFEDGEDILQGIKVLAKTEDIRAAVLEKPKSATILISVCQHQFKNSSSF